MKFFLVKKLPFIIHIHPDFITRIQRTIKIKFIQHNKLTTKLPHIQQRWVNTQQKNLIFFPTNPASNPAYQQTCICTTYIPRRSLTTLKRVDSKDVELVSRYLLWLSGDGRPAPSARELVSEPRVRFAIDRGLLVHGCWQALCLNNRKKGGCFIITSAFRVVFHLGY